MVTKCSYDLKTATNVTKASLNFKTATDVTKAFLNFQSATDVTKASLNFQTATDVTKSSLNQNHVSSKIYVFQTRIYLAMDVTKAFFINITKFVQKLTLYEK
jgi:hypothetical protein